MNNKKIMTREELEQLPSEQLQQMLCQVLSSDVPDAELYRQLMDILKERSGGDACTEAGHDNEKLYINKKPRRVWRWVAVAAVLTVVLTVAVPTAMGQTNVLDVLGQWRDSVVAFFTGEQPEPEPYTFKTDHPGLQEIYDTVSALGVTQTIVPTWVPEGYELTEIKTKNYPTKIKVTALLTDEEKSIVFVVEIYGAEVSKQVESDDPNASKIELAGVDYHITSNEDKWVAIWSSNNTECSLSVEGDKDVLIAIIRSIYISEE